MFEFNTDPEFDEIFGESFQPDKLEAPKRSFENDDPIVEPSKKPCFEWKPPKIPARSTMFLKKINDISNNTNYTSSEAGPSTNSSQPHSISRSPFSPLRKNPFGSPMKKIVSRKFPGPAGLLPERNDFNIKTLEEVNTKETKQVDMDICSQMSVKAFREGPWELMSKDFSPCGSNGVVFLPDKYNIAWIKAKMKSNKLINQKAPFLAAIVQKIECVKLKTPVVTMILKDATGQIHGTIVHDLYEEHIDVLKEGSVVILKQFGVLTTVHGSNHYLTITANNLVSVYSEETTDQNNSVAHHEDNFSEVKITVVQKLSVEDFLKNINEVKSRHKAALLEQKLNPGGLNFGSVHLNLRPLSGGSLSCMTEVPKMEKIERSFQGDSKFVMPNYRNLSMKNIMSDGTCNVRSDHDQNFMNSCNTSPANVNLNKENNVSLLNGGSGKSRFNFKTCNLNKQNEMLQSSSSSHSLIAQSPERKTQTLMTNDTNKNKSQLLVMNVNKNLSQPVSNNTTMIKCSRISVTSDNLEHSAILQNVFEGVDADLLFEDF